MQSIFSMLAGEHALHGDLFTRACGGVREGDWGGARQALAALTEAIERHLRIEDDCILRPLAKIQGPVGTLRVEHAQVRGVLLRMAESLAELDRSAFMKHAGTLRLVLQFHYQKREAIRPQAGSRLASGQVRHGVHQRLTSSV